MKNDEIMKFETKEELIVKLIEEGGYQDGMAYAVHEVFKSFKERIEFYEIYIADISLLYNDFPEIYKKVQIIPLTTYQERLFKYCFGDIK